MVKMCRCSAVDDRRVFIIPKETRWHRDEYWVGVLWGFFLDLLYVCSFFFCVSGRYLFSWFTCKVANEIIEENKSLSRLKKIPFSL